LGVPATAADVGGGLARLGQRDGLPAPSLRLDATLVADLEHGGQAVEVAKGLVALARALRTSVVADGVETAGQAALLRALGCDLAQGPYVGAPAPAGAIGALLARDARGEGGDIPPP
jgi:EAL domain-containing protein (putative c-di-GMP-specific phosphodiesterase class I)